MEPKSIGPKPAEISSAGLNGSVEPKSKKSEGAFERLLDETITKVATLQKEADNAIEELASGSGDVVQAMMAIEKAQLSFQTMVEIRNKLLNAYEEIMRMQL